MTKINRRFLIACYRDSADLYYQAPSKISVKYVKISMILTVNCVIIFKKATAENDSRKGERYHT